MSHENPRTIHKILSQNHKERTTDDIKILYQWLTIFQLFQCFRDESDIEKLISLFELKQLKSNQIIIQQEGIELCYVVSGSIVVDLKTQMNQTIKKKSKKQIMMSKDYILRPFPGKASIIMGKDEHNQIILLSSKEGRKLINKKLTSKWGDLARIIQRQPLFKYLDKDTLLDIAKTAKVMSHPYNSVIYNKGQQALYSYILMFGNVRILSDNIQVSYLNPEQIFGDEQILSGKLFRQYKAVCYSQKVKLIRIKKSEVQKALDVLTVLGKQKSVQKYLQSKNDYRRAISLNMKKLFFKQKDYEFKNNSRQDLPLYKYKQHQVDQYSTIPMSFQNPQDNTFFQLKLIDSLKSKKSKRVILDRQYSPTARNTFYTRKSLQPKLKQYRHNQSVKFPSLFKYN